MDTVELPDLAAYLQGININDRAALKAALAKVPCPEGYALTLLENGDVMIHETTTTPDSAL
jgi:hypothetical protein